MARLRRHRARYRMDQRFVAEAEPRGGARPPTLDEDVGSGDEVEEPGSGCVVAHVEDATLFAAVVGGVGRSKLVTPRVAAGRLDPHDIGAVIREDPGGTR